MEGAHKHSHDWGPFQWDEEDLWETAPMVARRNTHPLRGIAWRNSSVWKLVTQSSLRPSWSLTLSVEDQVTPLPTELERERGESLCLLTEGSQ